MSSLLTKLSIAVAATMLTLTPALAHGGKHSHGHGYHQSHGNYTKYQKRKHAHHFHRHHHHRYHNHRYHSHRYLKPRLRIGFSYGYRPYRGW